MEVSSIVGEEINIFYIITCPLFMRKSIARRTSGIL